MQGGRPFSRTTVVNYHGMVFQFVIRILKHGDPSRGCKENKLPHRHKMVLSEGKPIEPFCRLSIN